MIKQHFLLSCLFFVCLCLFATACTSDGQSSTLPTPHFGKQAPVLRNYQDTQGHFSVEVVESSVPIQNNLISFGLLSQWNFDAQNPESPVPEAIKALHEKDIALVGFVFPLEEKEKVTSFLLTASTQTCCYGPRPQFNQYILVESREPVLYQQGKPLLVSGKFYVEPKPQDCYIFRMAASTIENAPDQPLIRATGSESENIATIPKLAWEDMENPDIASLTRLFDQRLLVDGQLVGAGITDSKVTITLGKYPWDGCCTGVFPTSFNSVTVHLASGSPIPPPWIKSASIIGTCKASSPEDNSPKGLFSINDALILGWSHKATGSAQIDSYLKPPMITAAENSDLPLIKLFIRKGFNVNERRNDGMTALHIAALTGSAEICHALIQASASTDALCQTHETPLHNAARDGNIPIMEILASAGADLNIKDKMGVSPLALAVTNSYDLAAAWLIDHGADIRVENNEKQGLLHLAVLSFNSEIVKSLIKQGVPTNTRDILGQTPLTTALQQRNTHMADLLKSLGINE